MRVIKSQVKNSEYPKQTKCEYCGAELEYEAEDERIGAYGCKYIICPECERKTMVDEDRCVHPVWPDTFYDFSNSVDVSADKVQEWVDNAMKYLIESNEDFDHYTAGSGNTMVFAFKNGVDGIEIYVAKNYWDDFIVPDDYNLLRKDR